MLEHFYSELWTIFMELSPALLLGLGVAGLLHMFVPKGLIERRLSANTTRSVFEAAVLGVPMPLCSCGVVPTAIGLKNDGASKGAATSFLISTPQTGIDSILVSASFLGWPFALFKVAAAFISGMIGGVLVNAFSKNDSLTMVPTLSGNGKEKKPTGVKAFFNYVIFDLLGMIDLWILVGVIAAAVISMVVPTGYLAEAGWAHGLTGMLLMLLLAMPLYVCTTGSVPIAASLIAAGMPLGTALVFLMAGPATNVATMGAVYRALGARVLAIYLGTVAVLSIVFGLFFDFVISTGGSAMEHMHHETDWIAIISSVIVVGLLAFLSGRRIYKRFLHKTDFQGADDMDLTLKVQGMSCGHCVANVKKTLEAFEEVQEATPDLASGNVIVKGDDLDQKKLAEAVEKAGYKVIA